MQAWQDDYYPGSCDYPSNHEPPLAELDPWEDPAYVRAEDAE